jgi:site-specific DNA-methyltransferase (adenine-specific)
MAVSPAAPSRRNRTLRLSVREQQALKKSLIQRPPGRVDHPPGGIACDDSRRWPALLPPGSVDLLFLDPPYNLTRSFGSSTFRQRPVDHYTDWLEDVLISWMPVLAETATVYICGDWRTSHSIYETAARHLVVRNRITWEREKGRGARANWKSNSEDIWFCTVGREYTFNARAVCQRRPVIAPYRNSDRSPRDWQETGSGNFRDTHASNIWTDISVPFWSMPENTDHPTQKSEKLLARLILASTNEGDFVLDPFAGSGTTCVVARKLGRRFLGIECEMPYALLALRRLELADQSPEIQGYRDGVFWPRNVRPAGSPAKSPRATNRK